MLYITDLFMNRLSESAIFVYLMLCIAPEKALFFHQKSIDISLISPRKHML